MRREWTDIEWAAYQRCRHDRPSMIATLVRVATERGSTLTWHEAS